MAKFKCKNCEHTFEKFCDEAEEALGVKCPKCGSHWIELIKNDTTVVLPWLPYIDRPYPKPYIDPVEPSPWPQDPVNPWPPNRYWIHTPIRHSINKHTGSVSVW